MNMTRGQGGKRKRTLEPLDPLNQDSSERDSDISEFRGIRIKCYDEPAPPHAPPTQIWESFLHTFAYCTRASVVHPIFIYKIFRSRKNPDYQIQALKCVTIPRVSCSALCRSQPPWIVPGRCRSRS